MDSDIILDEKNMITMKLLHYFITERNYNPIILQGVDNEIWLENLEEDCKVVRIVSGYIHNDEQFQFDVFKTKRILKKIRKKTFSLNLNVISFFLDLGENVSFDTNNDSKLMCVKVKEEKDISKNKLVKEIFPDLDKKMVYSEEGLDLFMKISGDINVHNKEDASRLEKVFKNKVPYITYFLVAVNLIFYFIPVLLGQNNNLIFYYATHGPSIRDGQYIRLITGMFLHGGLLHVGLNCYNLKIIGSQIESFLGKFKFLFIYLFSGIMGALFSMIFNGNTASIGASGAIFGLLGALVYFGYYYRVYFGNILKTQIIPLILLNLFLGFMLPGVDNFAHIGGLIGGLLVTRALGIKDKTTTFEKVNGWIILTIFTAFIGYIAFVYSA